MLLALLTLLIAPALAGDPSLPAGASAPELALYGVGGINFLLTLLFGGRHLQSGGSLSRLENDVKVLESKIGETRERYLTRADFDRMLSEVETRTAERLRGAASAEIVTRISERTDDQERQLRETRENMARVEVRLDAIERLVRSMEGGLEQMRLKVDTSVSQQNEILTILRSQHGHGR